jgi:glycosyltransferase involved in cell wall biosynthesis
MRFMISSPKSKTGVGADAADAARPAMSGNGQGRHAGPARTLRLSIVMCVYNEAASVLPVLERVCQVQPIEGWQKEIIVVDNDSTDGTRDMLERFHAPDVRIIFHERNLGKSASVRTGFREATGDYAVIQDADFEYDPAELTRFMATAAETGADAVFGSRTLGHRAIYKYRQNYWGVLGLTAITNWLYGGHLTDVAVGTKMVKRDVFHALDLRGNGFDLDFELPCKLLKRGYTLVEIPIGYHPRTIAEGKKIRAVRDGWRALSIILRERFT